MGAWTHSWRVKATATGKWRHEPIIGKKQMCTYATWMIIPQKPNIPLNNSTKEVENQLYLPLLQMNLDERRINSWKYPNISKYSKKGELPMTWLWVGEINPTVRKSLLFYPWFSLSQECDSSWWKIDLTWPNHWKATIPMTSQDFRQAGLCRCTYVR